MPRALASLCLLACFITIRFCLILKATERDIYTGFTRQALRYFFTTIPTSRENYLAFSKLFESRHFKFKTFYYAARMPERLEFIEENYKSIPMRHAVTIFELQRTEYGRTWLLDNLNKLADTDLHLYDMEPNLFTIEEQRTILTFTLKHQLRFQRYWNFCTIFQDLDVFDHEWLWLYLTPICHQLLPDERRQTQLVEILKKQAHLEKDANLTALFFLILLKDNPVLINWNTVGSKQPELVGLLQNYEEACSEKKEYAKIWRAYESLASRFKDFPLGGHSETLLHLISFVVNYSTKAALEGFDAATEFMIAYPNPSHMDFDLLKFFWQTLGRLNYSWNPKFKLPRNWKDTILKGYMDISDIRYIPRALQLGVWRIDIMTLTPNKSSEPVIDPKRVYANATINEILAVDHFTHMNSQLINDKRLELEPILKFDCNFPELESCVLDFWIHRIYQLAINEKDLPSLDSKLKEAIFMSHIEIDNHRHDLNLLNGLASAVCLDPSDISFDTIKMIITSTKTALDQYDISFYYDPQATVTIFE